MRSFRSVTRQVHLLGGLLLSLVVCFYCISGAAILFIRYLPGDSPEVTTERITMPPPTVTATDALLRDLMTAAAGAYGRIQPLEPLENGGYRLRYQQPGMVAVADLAPDRSEMIVTRTRHGPLRVLRHLHTLTGRDGGPGFAVWSMLLDLVALAVIAFAASGIYLWYRLARDRRLGWLILGGTWCYTLGLIAYLMLT